MSSLLFLIGAGFMVVATLRSLFEDTTSVRTRDERRDDLLLAIAFIVASIAAK